MGFPEHPKAVIATFRDCGTNRVIRKFLWKKIIFFRLKPNDFYDTIPQRRLRTTIVCFGNLWIVFLNSLQYAPIGTNAIESKDNERTSSRIAIK